MSDLNQKNMIDLANFNPETIIEQFKELKVNGYHILIFIYVPPIATKSAGGILYANETLDKHIDAEYRSTVGLVIGMGSEVYPQNRFPDGPWCKVGDWVVFPRHHGTQFKCDDTLLINIADDKILNVIDNPNRISR